MSFVNAGSARTGLAEFNRPDAPVPAIRTAVKLRGDYRLHAFAKAGALQSTHHHAFTLFELLIAIAIATNTSSPITGIDLPHDGAGSRITIFALSWTTDPIAPLIVTNSPSQKANVGDNVRFTAIASAKVSFCYQWQKWSGGMFVDLSAGKVSRYNRDS